MISLSPYEQKDYLTTGLFSSVRARQIIFLIWCIESSGLPYYTCEFVQDLYILIWVLYDLHVDMHIL